MEADMQKDSGGHPHRQRHPGYFGHNPKDLIPATDDVREHSEEVTRLITYAKATFYALWCVWYYEHKSYDDGMRYDSAESLTALGRDLCEEIDRRIGHLDRAGKLWEERAQARKGRTEAGV
jgi:hypothetical protein